MVMLHIVKLVLNGYKEKIEREKQKSGLSDSVIIGTAKIKGSETVLIIFDSSFFMGTIGVNNGKKIIKGIEYATENKLSICSILSSGGIRVQEGIKALMQMAKICGALKKHDNAGLLYISILDKVVTGGTYASLGELGDIVIGIEHSIVSFAGKKVLNQTLNKDTDDNFQTVEFAYNNGMVDILVNKENVKGILINLINIYGGKNEK